ncbi:MAG: YcaO-like family protein [Pseudobacteriovorax sp.]|nr:YcaO-like family protein [Pseudobacteriovorax sp.]
MRNNIGLRNILNWIHCNQSKLGLKLTELNWTKGFKLKLYDFDCKIKMLGKEFRGRGTDEVKELAIAKAVAESVERSYFFANRSNLRTTNGLSVHISKEAAAESSKNELIERHAFLSHYLTGASIFDLRHKLSNDFPSFYRFIEDFEQHLNVKYFFGFLLDSPIKVVICYATKLDEEFGVIAGLGSEPCLVDAVQKSLIEATRIIVHHKNKPYPPLALKEFLKQNSPGPAEHLRVNLNPESHKFTIDRFNLTASPVKVDFSYIKLQGYSNKIEGTPFFVSAQSSPDLQGLFFGTPISEKVNNAILNREHNNYGGGIQSLVAWPHPIA